MSQANSNSVISVEFGVSRETSDGQPFTVVPVDQGVQSALVQMLQSTLQQHGAAQHGGHPAAYEPSQRYGPVESLTLPLNSPLCETPRALFNAANLPVDTNALSEPGQLEFYFAVFRNGAGQKTIGVKRASQFKAVVGARGRLMQMFGNQMQLLTDNVFKLDVDFDYIIDQSTVHILHPSGFEYTAEIDDHILAHAANNIAAVAQVVHCIDFSCVQGYAATHKRAARLLAALRTRADLALISLTRLVQVCGDTGINFSVTNGKLSVPAGEEMSLLMLLDRRRYALSLIDDVNELYEAANRRVIS